MWKSIALLLVFVCGVVGAGSVVAVSFEARDFDALASEADQIIIGTAAASNSRRTGAREIVTDYRFDDLQTVKGNLASDSLTLTMLGGSVGAETLTVAGAPTFQRGIRYLVFISGNGSVMFPLVGGTQGIFQIRRDASSGVSRVHDYTGRPLTRLPTRAPMAEVGSDMSDAMSEAAFVDAIRRKISGRGAR